MTDLVVTWPKSRSLSSYLHELDQAKRLGLEINFRVPHQPRVSFGAWRERPGRCYIVHDGFVRGYNEILNIAFRGAREVARVADDAFAGFWPSGWYIVRDPEWHPIQPVPMRGFRGFRYTEEAWE